MFNKKLILILPIVLLVLSAFVLAWLPPLPEGGGDDNTGDGTTPPEDNLLTYGSTLQITEIKADIDGKKDTITSDGEKISRDAKEESDIEFEIILKNIWDKKIKNIEVTVTIKNIDDGDDLEEDEYMSDLNVGDSDKAKFDFELPLKVDDDNYDVKIHIEGRDEDNNLHTLDWKLELEVKKDSHNVKITRASLSPSKVSCQRTSNLNVKLLNLGRDEEDIILEIESSYLNLDFKKKDIELETGTDDDAEHETLFRLNFKDNLEPGTYSITIKAHYNKGKSTTTKKANIVVEGCTQTKQTQNQVSIRSLPPQLSETLGELKTPTQGKTIISTTGDKSTILLLAIVLFIVLALIIFLLGVIMIRLKR